MTEVLSAPEAARLIGVSIHQVKAWMRRADDPLPSVLVGTSGRVRKVLARADRALAGARGRAGRGRGPAAARPARRR